MQSVICIRLVQFRVSCIIRQVGLNPSGTGTLVRMSTHLNAHLFLPFLWGSVEEGAVLDHAEALIEEGSADLEGARCWPAL